MRRSRMIAFVISLVLMISGLCACNADINVNTEQPEKPAEDKAITSETPSDEAPVEDEIEEKTPAADEISEEDTVVLPEIESVSFDMTEYDKDKDHKIFESHGNSYFLSDISSRDYPLLAEKLIEIDKKEKDFYRQAIEDSREYAEEFAKEQRENGEDYTFFRYSETQLMSCDEKAVSMLRTEYGYLGGAHPDYYYDPINLYSATGEDISLSDILTDDEALRKILKDRLNKEYPDGNFFDLDDSLDTYVINEKEATDGKFSYMFTINPSGIMFYFSPYDLNSYADGTQQVEFSYSELADIIKPGFIYEDSVKEDLSADAEEAAKDQTDEAESIAQNDMAVKAPFFSGLENIRKENHDDGTYFYQDMTSDSMTTITNMCVPNSLKDGQAKEAYIKDLICENIDKDAKVTETEEDEDLSALLSYPAYETEWESGSNEDSKVGKGIVILTDDFSYYLGFACPLDYFEDNEEFYEDELDNVEMLHLD